jgi:hypothetical protein
VILQIPPLEGVFIMAESKPNAETEPRKVSPEVQGFIERVVVPALVKRYIQETATAKANRHNRLGRGVEDPLGEP